MIFEKRVQEAVKKKLIGYAVNEDGYYLQALLIKDEMYKKMIKIAEGLADMDVQCILHPKDCEKLTIRYAVYQNEDGKDCHTLTISFYTNSGMETKGYFLDGSLKYEMFIINGRFFNIHNRRYIPLTLKLLNSPYHFLRLFRDALLELLAEEWDIFKDILNDQDNISIPVTLNSILEKQPHNKKQLFEKQYRLGFVLPKSINKMSLVEGYCKIKLCKKTAPDERQKIWRYSFAEYNTCGKEIEIHLMEQYYEFLLLPYRERYAEAEAAYKKQQWEMEQAEVAAAAEGDWEAVYEDYHIVQEELYTAKEELDTITMILHDYLVMSKKTDPYFRLTIKSARKMWEQHDALIPRYLKKTCRGRLTIPKESPFYKMHLPDEYEKITTKKRLCEEGIRNRNCVAGYLPQINAGKCVICSILWNGMRYTIEIRIKRKKFYLAQLEGFGNIVKVPQELKEKIKADIGKLNVLGT